MFGTLNEKLEKIVKSISGKAIISENDLVKNKEINKFNNIKFLGSGLNYLVAKKYDHLFLKWYLIS